MLFINNKLKIILSIGYIPLCFIGLYVANSNVSISNILTRFFSFVNTDSKQKNAYTVDILICKIHIS